MNVLVTAATTALGRALIDELSRQPAMGNIVGVRSPHEAPPAGAPTRVRHVAADLTRRREVEDLLRGATDELAIDVVVHTPLHRDPRDQGKRVFRQNVESTRHLLAAAEKQSSVRRFVLCSSADVYRIETTEAMLIDEEHPLELSPDAPQRTRDRAEADLLVCAKMGLSRLAIAVLRCAETLAEGTGSQLHDYLSSKVCLRPLGYDPMLNLLSLPDAARALRLAVCSDAVGIFNVPGRDTLPLSELIFRMRRWGVPVPGPALKPLYGLRALLTRGRFRYQGERERFHYGAILDGSKAKAVLGYVPESALDFS